jgi:hypothetical protein
MLKECPQVGRPIVHPGREPAGCGGFPCRIGKCGEKIESQSGLRRKSPLHQKFKDSFFTLLTSSGREVFAPKNALAGNWSYRPLAAAQAAGDPLAHPDWRHFAILAQIIRVDVDAKMAKPFTPPRSPLQTSRKVICETLR